MQAILPRFFSRFQKAPARPQCPYAIVKGDAFLKYAKKIGESALHLYFFTTSVKEQKEESDRR